MRTDSVGANQLEALLNSEGVKFKREVSLCPGINKRMLKADFAIYGVGDTPVAVIEFDGLQHLQTGDKITDAQLNDSIKDCYCSEHGIKMLRVKYPSAGESVDYDLVSSFIEGVASQTPSIKTGVVLDAVSRRSLNLGHVELENLPYPSYSLDELGHLLERNPSYILNNYILGLKVLQNWSSKSIIGDTRTTRIAREDIVRFLVSQEALFQNNVQLKFSSPAIVHSLGDLTESLESLVICSSAPNLIQLLGQGLNLGHTSLELIQAGDTSSLYRLLKLVQSGRFANVCVDLEIDHLILTELRLVADSAMARFITY